MSKIETKTVREVAEILGVTKQAIFKKINQLPTELTPTKKNGTYQLSPRIVDFIVRNTRSTMDTPIKRTTDNQLVDAEVDTLKEMIEELKSDKALLSEQIAIKDEQLQNQNIVSTDNQPVSSETGILKEIIEDLKTDKTQLNEQIRVKDKELKETHDALIDNQSVGGMNKTVKFLLEQKDNEVKRISIELKEKNKQIDKLQSLLDQEQQLALQTKIQNNKLQLQIEEVEAKNEAEKEVTSGTKQAKKKWWQFFK